MNFSFADVRSFLGETLCREKLTPRAEEERLKLLMRLGPPPPAYLDMSRATTLPASLKSSPEPNCYETMSDSPLPSKSGSLSRRERFLFLEQNRKVWAKLSGSELYLYPGRSESRPASVIQLEGYIARPATSHKPFAFEIVCPGKKTYQFTACSEEEMSSWVEAVTDAGTRGKRELPPPPPVQAAPPPQEVYDTPDARLRPVTPPQEYERMISDSLYHEQLYKNVGIGKEEETCYYNLLPRDTEEIYQTITEEEKHGIGQSRIQAIIKAMEASIAEAQLYEPVDGTQER
ncbi:unnamed protein product [Nezara viridula]|uniref:PH domain-containing protein n=1 Tax=Nezara viridula TaxID=85310 RepID=A0A9P0MF29_NEZVI|nr:unnamed protein product [Nezara viridula]